MCKRDYSRQWTVDLRNPRASYTPAPQHWLHFRRRWASERVERIWQPHNDRLWIIDPRRWLSSCHCTTHAVEMLRAYPSVLRAPADVGYTWPTACQCTAQGCVEQTRNWKVAGSIDCCKAVVLWMWYNATTMGKLFVRCLNVL